MSSFQLFSLLPAEIRSNIYILATPPRIVHVHQQVESFEDFRKRLPHITIAERNLRPDVDSSSFRHLLLQASAILRRQRQSFFNQTKLEAYGFTSNKRAQFSWEFESIVPFDVLMQTPHIGISPVPKSHHLVPRSHSTASPCLLRVTVVAHQKLKEKQVARISHTLHHFRRRDISRVQRLALAMPTHSSRMFLGHKLNPDLKELILVEWGSSESEQALRQSIVDPTLLRPAPTVSQAYYKGEHLCMLPTEEIDALWNTLELDVFGVWKHWFYENSEDARLLKKHKVANGFDSHFMKGRLVQVREEYEQQKEAIEYNNEEYFKHPGRFSQKVDEYPPWSIHRIRFAHICTPYTAERIREHRLGFMEQFTKLAADAAQGEDGHNLSWTREHRLPHPFVL